MVVCGKKKRKRQLSKKEKTDEEEYGGWLRDWIEDSLTDST